MDSYETEWEVPNTEAPGLSFWALAAGAAGFIAFAFFLFWLPAPLLAALGLVFGVIGLISIHNNRGKLRGRRLAKLGIAVALLYPFLLSDDIRPFA